MSYYNNSSRPCVAGTTPILVKTTAGAVKVVMARDLKPGDFILSCKSRVEKVFIFEPAGKHELVRFAGGLEITPYHPVKTPLSEKWEYPIDVPGGELVEHNGGQLVDLLLEPGIESFAVSGFSVAAWGHGYTDPETDPVIGHAFFGSRTAIASAFSAHPDWDQGVIRIKETDLQAVRAESAPNSEPGLVQTYELQAVVA